MKRGFAVLMLALASIAFAQESRVKFSFSPESEKYAKLQASTKPSGKVRAKELRKLWREFQE
jgi:hypothetical protein